MVKVLRSVFKIKIAESLRFLQKVITTDKVLNLTETQVTLNNWLMFAS